jgi:hypothetical protein
MVLLSKYDSENVTTLSKIESLSREDGLRPYLGMSGLGHHCNRYLWLQFRWCYKNTIPARLSRLFQRGHNEEEHVVKILESIGCRCSGVIDNQAEFSAVSGHCKGHSDGMIENVPEAPLTPHVLEIKTAAHTKFNELKKKGLQKANPVYWAQIHLYMKHSGLSRALHYTVNKNNDNVYIERIRYDASFADGLIRKGTTIVLSEIAPSIIFPCSPTYFQCKGRGEKNWCDAYDVCFGKVPIEKNCRTCQAVQILDDGKWGCTKLGIELATGQQRLGCNLYEGIEV